MIKPKIIRRSDFSVTVQITTEPYEEGLLIQSSSTANPCVIETQLPHQLVTNDRVRINGHRKNTIVNGKQTVTVIDAFRFSIPVIGIITGEVAGRVGKAKDITDFVFTVKTKIRKGGSAIEDADPTLLVIPEVDGEIKLSLSKTQTPLIIPNSCILEVTYIDTDNKTKIFAVECEVGNA